MNINPDFPEGAALVIGGSGGTGFAICERLVQSGSDVALSYRSNEQRAGEAKAKIEQSGKKASIHSLSLGNSASMEKAVDDAIAAHGRIHTVVLAAGSDIKQPLISEITPEAWNEVVTQDLNGFVSLVHATLPHMKEKGGGSYVHISSAGLFRWPPRDALSVAPKAAIESLMRGIAVEEGRNNIRANSVALGVIETGIFLRLKEEGVFDDAWEQAVLDGLALKRFGQPEEVAEAAVWLASSRAAYVTGQIISVSGGYGL